MNNYDEFLKRIKEVVVWAEAQQPRETSEGKNEESLKQATAIPHCAIHDVDMKQRAYKDTSKGFYYDHRKNFGNDELPEWKKCHGKGWLES